MTLRLFLLAAIAPGLLTACGGGDEGGGGKTTYDKSEIVTALDLTESDNGLSYTFPRPGGGTCDIAVVLTSAQAVKLYADAGDTVATNPAETAGVKVVDEERASCEAELTEALKDV